MIDTTTLTEFLKVIHTNFPTPRGIFHPFVLEHDELVFNLFYDNEWYKFRKIPEKELYDPMRFVKRVKNNLNKNIDI